MADEMKDRIAHLRALHQTIEGMHEHVQMLEKQRSELEYVDESLDALGSVKAGTQVLVQISSGIFAPAKITDVNRLLVNVGADVMVEKDIAQTRTIIQDQAVQLAQVHGQLTAKLAELADQFEKLRAQVK